MGKVTVSSKLPDEEWKQRQIPFTYASEQYLGNLSKLYQCYIERNMYHYTRLHEYSLLKRFQYKRFPLPIPHVNRRPKGRPGDLRTATPTQGRVTENSENPAEGAQLPRLPGPRPSREAQLHRRPRPGFQNGNKPGPAPLPEVAGKRAPPPGGASQPARRMFPQAESARSFPFPSDFLPAHFRSPAN